MKLTKEQIKDFEIREKEANCCDDYISLASELIELDDKNRAIKLCKKAELLDLDNYEINSLASLVGDNEYGLSDKDWTRKLYKRAEVNSVCTDDLIQLANNIAGEYSSLNDSEWAIKILHQIINDLKEADEIIGVAHSLACFGDTETAIELFKIAENKVDYLRGFLYLAENISDSESLGDKEWAVKVFDKAKTYAENSNDYIELAKFCVNNIEDLKGAKILIIKAIDINENIQGKINTVMCLDYLIDDEEWINSLKPEILKLVKNKYTKFEGYEFQFGLESWGKDLHSGEPTWITVIIKNGIPTITKVELFDKSDAIIDNFHENDSISNFGLWPQSNDSDGLINVYDVIDPHSQDDMALWTEPVLSICITEHNYDLLEVPTGEFSQYESFSSLDQDGVLFLAEVMNLSLSKFFK